MKSLNKNIVPVSIVIICSTLFFTGSSCDSDDNGNNNVDTTSHNFVWEIDTIGTSGTLRDVFAISDDDVWVVGEIRTVDSTYNAAHWNGNEWELLRVTVRLEYPGGDVIYTNSDIINSVFFIDKEVWFLSSASGVTKLLNDKWIYLEIPWGSAPPSGKMWGVSSSIDIYFVGSNGSIVHYNGSSFTKMNSGTDVDLLDIWGTSDNDIWVAGKDYNESVILHYDGKSWSKFYEMDNTIDIYTLPEDEILLSVSSIWKDINFDTLLTVGAWGTFHVYTKNKGYSRWGYPRRWDIPDEINMGYPFRIRGSAYNNIFVVGQRNSILHYNGKSWHNYIEFYSIDGVWFRSVAVTDNSVYIVGYNVVMRGVRLE